MPRPIKHMKKVIKAGLAESSDANKAKWEAAEREMASE